MKIKVVNAGNCMICGKPIKLAVPEDSNKFPNIFFCRECEPKLEYDQKRPESEDKCKDCKWQKDRDEVFRRGVSMDDLCAACYVRSNRK